MEQVAAIIKSSGMEPTSLATVNLISGGRNLNQKKSLTWTARATPLCNPNVMGEI